MANYAVPALTSAAAGAGAGASAGSFLGPVGTAVGGILGALGGAGSSIYQTWQTEEQAKEMQDMIDKNYRQLLESINREYAKNIGGVGATYSAGAKANKVRTNQILGAQNLAGSPIAAALEREYGATSAANAGQQYTQLSQAKSNALLGAQEAYNKENQQLGLAKQQGTQTNFNSALESLGKAGGALGTALSPNLTLGNSLPSYTSQLNDITLPSYTSQLNDITLPEKVELGTNLKKSVN